MDYEYLTYNLKQNINKLRSYLSGDNTYSMVCRYIIDLANYHSYQVIGMDDSYYIKKGIYPKAVFHLNIDLEEDIEKLYLEDGDNPNLIGDNNINIINSLIIISSLLDLSSNDFDVLITNNNIQNNNKSFAPLKSLLRSDNIINLNLRQGRCIADDFSSLILSNVKVPIERDVEDSNKVFRLSLSNLIGGHTSEDLDKVRLNSIKTIIGIFRRIKSKVDIDLINIYGGDRYDYIPSSSYIDFCIKEEYVSDLYNIFNLYQSEFIEKNLKYEPNMQVSIDELDEDYQKAITEGSFDRLASFVELVPTGAYTVNSSTKELISSINLSTIRTHDDFIDLIIVYRSLSDENMKEMLEKTHTAAKIASSQINSRLQLPRWKNSDDSLTEVFKEVYHNLAQEDLKVIKTQYSLDSSVVFRKLNVKIISLGVEYKQGEDKSFYTQLSEIAMLANVLDEVLSQINSY